MTELFVTSSVLIAVIALLRTVLKGKISLRLQYALWLLVALRLLIPVNFFSSPNSVLNAVEPAYKAITVTTLPQSPAAPVPPRGDWGGTSGGTGTPGGVTAPAIPAAPVVTTPDVAAIARTIWLAGVGVMAVWFLCSDVLFRRRLRRSAKRVEAPDCPLPVYVTGAASTPCLYGLFRPAIYLTPDCAEEQTRRHVLAHEYTHYRHGDHFWALIRCVCLAIYWFHPLVWLAAALSRRDCELYCDEGAIKTLGEAQRVPYGRTLLSMVVPKVVPADLLRTATTMTSGKGGVRERVTLIAKKPREAIAVLVAAALIVGVAVSCTFTGAEKPGHPELPLEEALLVLPDSLKDRVVLIQETEREGTTLAAYHIPDYETKYGGWMFSVARITPVEFEQGYAGSEGTSYLGRDEDWYYVRYFPTDVRTAHYEEYQPAVEEAQAWVDEVLAAHPEVKPMTDDPVYQAFASDCTFAGPHINVLYKPYYGLTNYGAENTDKVYTLLLSQPVKQGEGGIWCVDRWYDGNGTAYMWLPKTDVTLAEYYADLQAKADAGEADWALDPTELCVKYVKEQLGHDRQPGAFTVGEVYEGTPQVESTATTINEGVKNRLGEIMGGETGTVVLSLETHSDGEFNTKNISVPSQDTNGPYLAGRATIDYTWSDAAVDAYFNGGTLEPEEYDWAVVIYNGDMTRYFKFFEGSEAALYHDEASGDNWYKAAPNEYHKSIAQHMRGWYDEKEYLAAVGAATATGADFDQAAWNWMERLSTGMRALSPGNQYELLDVQPYSADVYDTIPGDDTQFCFTMRLAFKLENPEASLFNAGAGLNPIESGPFAGYQSWGMEVVMRREGDTWYKLDWGSGGYQLENYQ